MKLAIIQQINMARDVATGMGYLSTLGFIHRVSSTFYSFVTCSCY